MRNIDQTFFEGDFNLRKTINSFLRHWKLLLPLVILGGLLMGAYSYYQQTTTVTATITFKNPDLTDLIYSDTVKQAIADKLGVPITGLQKFVVEADKSDKNLYMITVDSKGPQENLAFAQAWAEVTVEQAKTIQKADANDKIKAAEEVFDKTNSDLVDYLQKNRLATLSWSELLELTGVSNPSGSLIVLQGDFALPNISSDVKMEVTRLMSKKIIAEKMYNDVFSTNQAIIINMENSNTDYYIYQNAQLTGMDIKKVLTNILLGALVVVILGVIVILVSEWWKNPTPTNEVKK